MMLTMKKRGFPALLSMGLICLSCSSFSQEKPDFRPLGRAQWTFQTQGKIFSSPVLSGGVAYIGSEDSCLYAIDARNGRLRWKYPTGGAVSSTPAVRRNIVFFGSYDGNYYAVSTTTGKLVWKYRTGGEKKVGDTGLWTMQPTNQYMDDLYDFFLSSPVIDSNDSDPLLYFGSSDGNLYCLHAGNGTLAWKFSTRGLIHSSPALAHGMVYIGSWDTFLYALDARTGQLKWNFKTGDQPVYHLMEGIQASPVCYEDKIYFGARDGFFYALNAFSGEMSWKYSANGSWIVANAAVQNGIVYFGTSDSYLFVAADARTGKELYHFKGHGYLYSSPTLSGNTGYFGDFTGKMYALDLLSAGKAARTFVTPGGQSQAETVLNRQGDIDFGYIAAGDSSVYYSTGIKVMNALYSLGPIVSSPAVADGVLYFGSADHTLYAIRLEP